MAIADVIGRAIDSHELRPGDRLPPQRQLAHALEVDLTTITRAYAEARRRGLIEATVGRGTFIRGAAVPAGHAPPVSVDMSMNPPPLPDTPSLRQMLREGLTGLLDRTDLGSLMSYHLGAGMPEDRAAAAAWLRPVLGEADPARTLVCTGAQSTFIALLTLLARPGDVILAAPLTYPRFRAAAAQLGVRLAAVAADEEGLLPEALDMACRTLAPKAVYCVPTIQNPTTTTMSPARRGAIAEVVLRHRLSVIEDDAYGLLPRTPLPAIATLAPEVTYYVGTLAKCLSPGLRIAYAVAPGKVEATRLEAAIRATVQMPHPLMTAMVSGWIRDGQAAALRDGVRREIAARQAMAREILPAGSFRADPDGPHLWLSLPPGWHRMAFGAHVRGLGLTVAPSDAFVVGEAAPNAVRIGLGAAENHTSLGVALRAVAGVLAAEPPPELGDIV